ncbi:MAG: hypothetical protein AAF598_04360 [Bacteroidota bacterium]
MKNWMIIMLCLFTYLPISLAQVGVDNSKDVDLSFLEGNWQGEWIVYDTDINGYELNVVTYSNLLIHQKGEAFQTTHKYYDQHGIGAPKTGSIQAHGAYLDFWGRTYIVKGLKRKKGNVSLAAVAVAHKDDPDKGKEWLYLELQDGELQIKEVHEDKGQGEDGLQKSFVLTSLDEGGHWIE